MQVIQGFCRPHPPTLHSQRSIAWSRPVGYLTPYLVAAEACMGASRQSPFDREVPQASIQAPNGMPPCATQGAGSHLEVPDNKQAQTSLPHESLFPEPVQTPA